MAVNSRKVRYGYNADGSENPEQQKVIRTVLDLRRKGFSLELIAKELTDEGVPTARGGQWRGNTVKNILEDNPDEQGEQLKAAPQERQKALFDDIERDREVNGFEWEEQYTDSDTGETKTRVHWLPPDEWKAWREREELERAALARLTVAEKLERFSFTVPMPVRFGMASAFAGGDGVDRIVTRMTAITGRDVHQLLDKVEGQKDAKRDLRKAVNLLLQELAIQRQINIVLRDQLRAANIQPKVLKTAE